MKSEIEKKLKDVESKLRRLDSRRHALEQEFNDLSAALRVVGKLEQEGSDTPTWEPAYGTTGYRILRVLSQQNGSATKSEIRFLLNTDDFDEVKKTTLTGTLQRLKEKKKIASLDGKWVLHTKNLWDPGQQSANVCGVDTVASPVYTPAAEDVDWEPEDGSPNWDEEEEPPF